MTPMEAQPVITNVYNVHNHFVFKLWWNEGEGEGKHSSTLTCWSMFTTRKISTCLTHVAKDKSRAELWIVCKASVIGSTWFLISAFACSCHVTSYQNYDWLSITTDLACWLNATTLCTWIYANLHLELNCTNSIFLTVCLEIWVFDLFILECGRN